MRLLPFLMFKKFSRNCSSLMSLVSWGVPKSLPNTFSMSAMGVPGTLRYVGDRTSSYPSGVRQVPRGRSVGVGDGTQPGGRGMSLPTNGPMGRPSLDESTGGGQPEPGTMGLEGHSGTALPGPGGRGTTGRRIETDVGLGPRRTGSHTRSTGGGPASGTSGLVGHSGTRSPGPGGRGTSGRRIETVVVVGGSVSVETTPE